MDLEKLERLLKTALIMTFLMCVFSTGMNAAMIARSSAEGLTVWDPIWRALLIVGPILLAELLGYRYVHKKNEEAAAERERLAKEKAKQERKAKAEARRAKQNKKKK